MFYQAGILDSYYSVDVDYQASICTHLRHYLLQIQ